MFCPVNNGVVLVKQVQCLLFSNFHEQHINLILFYKVLLSNMVCRHVQIIVINGYALLVIYMYVCNKSVSKDIC